jgi:hypothetical protein
MGVRVTPQGDTINSFGIACAAGVQTYPSVIFNGTDYIAVWSDCRLGRYYINTTRITPSGTTPDSGCWVGIAGAQDEDSPDLAYNGERSLCVWSEENYGVRGRFIDDLGQPEDTVITIALFTITSYTSPVVASSGSNYLVIWFERSGAGDWDIFGQLVSAQGSAIGPPVAIATGANAQYDADILFDGVNYYVVWRETSNYIYGRRVGPDGNLIGPAIPISESSAIYRYQPTLVNSPEHYFIVWSEWRGDYFDIYGNVDIEPEGVGELPGGVSGNYAILAPTVSHGQCRFRYGIEAETRTRISLYDAAGRHVRSLFDGLRKPGEYDLDIPARFLVTGIYFVRIQTDSGVVIRKLTVVH